jgi:hypothetical protein
LAITRENMELCQNLFSAPSVFPPLFFPNPVSPCGHAAKNKFSERKNDKGEFDQPTELVEIFGGAPWSVRAKYLLFLMVASSSCPNQVASGAGKGCCGQFGIAPLYYGDFVIMVDECLCRSNYYKNVPAQCLNILSLYLT